ncbi:MAG: sigma 54-interacting transcriptional regulator, partial [Pseudomonadota bacterium]
MSRILIVDDDPELRRSLTAAVSDPFQVDEAVDGVDALVKVRATHPDLVVLDMDMPRMGGMAALKEIKKFDPRIIVLILTAYSTVPDAVAAIREGAFNYIAKPVRHADLRTMVERALEAHEMVRQVANSAPILKDASGVELSSRSGEMQKVFALIERLALVDTAVLLRGESGTGKEIVARAIHFNSLRKEGRFVGVNLSAIPETLAESELFGHEKGSFTGADQRKIGKFQYADGGTLFLDEIGDISP